jgi:hypothetical protein
MKVSQSQEVSSLQLPQAVLDLGISFAPRGVEKEAWAKRIEDKAAAQAEAARPSEVSHAQVTTLAMQRRSLADAVQIALTRFKRDLKNLGMTEAQIHEIIPDTSSSTAGVKPTPPSPTPPSSP